MFLHRVPSCPFRFRSLVLGLLVSVQGAAFAQSVDEVRVIGNRTANAAGVGVLGQKPIIETPLSVTGYTADMIQDQISFSTSEVLANDSSVRLMGANDGNYDNMMIRGFQLTASAFSLNGLYGVLPWNVMSPESVERFEVIRGPSTTLTGSSPFGAIGGAINIAPKRAGDRPITQATAYYDAGGQPGLHVDLGRRFGSDEEFGARLNASARNGETAVDNQEEETSLLVAGFDYRGERLRLSADFGVQDMETDGATFSYFIEPGVPVPPAPDSDENPFPAWAFAKSRDAYGAVHGEFDIAPGLTIFAAAGARDHNSVILNPYADLDDPTTSGGLTVYPYHEPYFADTDISTQGGLAWSFGTGAAEHRLVLSSSVIEFDVGWFDTFYTEYASNLFQSDTSPMPDLTGVPAEGEAPTTIENRLSGLSLVDDISLLDDRLHVLLGLRQQRFEVDRVNDPANNYDEETNAPAAAVLYRVTPEVSVYANYMEGLSQGDIAPVGTVNTGEVFEPYSTEQLEVGLKYARDSLFASLSWFEISKPFGVTNAASNVFGINGEQRNRGLELTFSGQVIDSMRVLGGAQYLDAELTSTEGGLLDGNQAFGVPELSANLGLEWDVPGIPGFSLTSRVLYTDSQYADADNTQQIASWTRWDAGARYATVVNDRPLTLRLYLINLSRKDYWSSAASSGGNQLTMGAPFSAMFSATASF
jgi:iron complex outermembrane receptor protein